MPILDSARPVFFRVAIDASGLESAGDAVGFVDPTLTYKYEQIKTRLGDEAAPTVSDGDTIKINGIAVTFTTSVGLDLAGIIDAINALTPQHHVVASDDGALSLTNERLYEGVGITVTEVTPGVLAAIGFVTTTDSVGASVSTLAFSRAKARANARWHQMLLALNTSASTYHVGSVVSDGEVDADPTLLEFTVGYYLPNQVTAYDESNNNALLEGTQAIKRLVARALMFDASPIMIVFNPTLDGAGFKIGNLNERLHIATLAADLATAEAAITVTPIVDIR